MKIYASNNDAVYDIVSQFVGQDIWVRTLCGNYDFWVKFTDVDRQYCTGYAARCIFTYEGAELVATYDLAKSMKKLNKWELKYIKFPEPFEILTTDELFDEIQTPGYLT